MKCLLNSLMLGDANTQMKQIVTYSKSEDFVNGLFGKTVVVDLDIWTSSSGIHKIFSVHVDATTF